MKKYNCNLPVNSKKSIVISAVNIVNGGPLTILNSCLHSLVDSGVDKEFRVIVLVNKASMFDYPALEFIEYPKSKKSWLNRIYYEYFGFRKFSKELKPYFWLSLHDITPSIKAEIRAVYCHNSTPFLKVDLNDWRFNYKVALFALFYKHLYKINIKKNDYVIVQQQWLKDAFVDMYKLDKNKVIVAYANSDRGIDNSAIGVKNNSDNKVFFYPSLPRHFKNFEVICEAVDILNKRAVAGFEVIITVDGSENNYSKWLLSKYKNIENIKFEGLIPYEKIENYYKQTDCLIFPSKLETWGLAISEYNKYNRPMLLADLPYAYETSNGAQKVSHFDPLNPKDLADKMETFIKGDTSIFVPQKEIVITPPFVIGFEEMFKTILIANKHESK